jgi:Rps23 Pro-64 3,4-dihydroxylase Tpa1-like proline 4-hydroxylase
MIRTYNNVLDEELIKNVIEYFKFILDKNVWGSSIGWDQNLSLISSNTLTHRISNKSLEKEIKNSIEKVLDVDFEKEELTFVPSIYVWSGGSYITWHSDDCYPYNGTIYLNEEWDSDDGGVFLYKDIQTKEIKGIEPTYNSMVVNSATETNPHNLHCVTCIVPGTIKKRVTIQWRTNKIDKTKKTNIKYQ